MEELSDFLSRTSVTTTDSNGVLNADVTQTTSPTLAKPSMIKNEKDVSQHSILHERILLCHLFTL